jgi:hypothetical protein
MTELEKRMWEDDIKFITKLREEKEELQRRINETIEYIETVYLEGEICKYQNNKLLKILKGEPNNDNV